MKKRMLLLILAFLMLAVQFPAALAQGDVMYDDWLTAAIADALGYESLDDLIAKNGFSTQPKSVSLYVELGESGLGGSINPVYQEASMVFLEDIVYAAPSKEQMESLVPTLEAIFPFDYFAKLPGPYTGIEVTYLLQGEGPTRHPAYAVVSTDFAVGTYDDLEDFAGVIDLNDYIWATIDDYVSANIEGVYDGGVVIINSQFLATGVLTKVILFPYGY